MLLESAATSHSKMNAPSASLHAQSLAVQVQLLMTAGQASMMICSGRSCKRWQKAEGLIGYPFEPSVENRTEIAADLASFGIPAMLLKRRRGPHQARR